MSEVNNSQLIREALRSLNLPTSDPAEIVGRTYIFGNGVHVICGTITSIGFGKAEGVKLYISSPRYEGKEVVCLKKIKEGWAAQGPKGAATMKGGSLELL